ncbi:uncharacterized protein PAC_10740 [Phialocephala subalpina]|uniref:Uncharacterized protein n=1 Tax=Phialocephala subalpina TaxID=576137 RepID=A0A1L7X743_9HELO|nr:uncharacterized protein PAC_10740 [Phialocephala subalpina]
MAFLRSLTALPSFSRQVSRSTRQPITTRYLSSTSSRFAQGYGDGEGDPKGENPQQQGSSNETKQNAEHPGPAPPSEGQGTGAGPTKGESGKTQEEASAQSGGSRSKDAKETGSSPTAGSVGGSGGKSSSPDTSSKKEASPKLHDESVPGKDNSSDKQAEVEKHNREFEQGHDRAQAAAEDKVDKKFWEGHGGADKDL